MSMCSFVTVHCAVSVSMQLFVCVCVFQVKIFAPNIEQMHVVDHLKGNPSDEKRNVLVESARLARGNIQDLAELKAKEFDAVIFPGEWWGVWGV